MATQRFLDLDITLPEEVYDYGKRASGEVHGVVLTKPHIVELILDLAGYKATRDLTAKKILEPSCGDGVFVVAAVQRLLSSARRYKVKPHRLIDCVRAFDIDRSSVDRTRGAVRTLLEKSGVRAIDAVTLAAAWVVHGDFLLTPMPWRFDAVVGNPPYIRIEQLAPSLQALYRSRYSTLYDRADLYVAFIERGLDLLGHSGVLSYICADRWTMNRYGAPLRRLVSKRFSVRAYIDLHQASPFEADVIAYPSILALQHQKPTRTLFAKLKDGSPAECRAVALLAAGRPDKATPVVEASWSNRWFDGDEPWVLSNPAQLVTLRDLEAQHKLLEADGKTRVGIGVATGCDSIFIVGDDTGIEEDRLIPLVMRSDIEHGQIAWARRFVINAFVDNGQAVDLESFPGLKEYLSKHEPAIRKRHVSQRNHTFWFRTIDRVYPGLVSQPKLLVPDIAGSNEVAFDNGHYHPHHNLYFIVSDSWDLEVLGGLLSSKVALFFVWSYAVKMRGGYLRFQAQYLRRIRVPDPSSLSEKLKDEIRDAFRRRDFSALDLLALKAYRIKALTEFDFVDTRN